jgi:hypothetical protein
MRNMKLKSNAEPEEEHEKLERWRRFLNMQRNEEARRIFFCRVFAWVIALTLPATILALVAARWLERLTPHPDVLGLTAVSIGIMGVMVFFIFLYKYQILAQLSTRKRIRALLAHAAMVILLFILVIWLGFASPWSRMEIWGNWDLETASRSWVITVIVVGTISLLGSFFDFIRLQSTSRDTETKDDKDGTDS